MREDSEPMMSNAQVVLEVGLGLVPVHWQPRFRRRHRHVLGYRRLRHLCQHARQHRRRPRTQLRLRLSQSHQVLWKAPLPSSASTHPSSGRGGTHTSLCATTCPARAAAAAAAVPSWLKELGVVLAALVARRATHLQLATACAQLSRARRSPASTWWWCCSGM